MTELLTLPRDPRDPPDGVGPAYVGSDAIRRLALTLRLPRTVAGLTAFVTRHDPHVPHDPEWVASAIERLVATGFVSNIGTHPDPESAVAAQQGDDTLWTLHHDVADGYVDRVRRGRGGDTLTLDGDLYVLTQGGWDALQAPAGPVPPQLEGAALQAAEEFNRRLAKETTALESDGLREARERLQAEIDRLETRP